MPAATHESNESIEDEEVLGYTFGDGETRSQMQLLDELQEIGLSEYIDLPQLVVVSNQSTGKSSVLQAVTRIPFAVDDKMCTRFATEIVLKHSSTQETTTKIQIIPDPREPKKRRQQLLCWKPDRFSSSSTLSKANMQMIFKQAEAIIFETAPGFKLVGSTAFAPNFGSASSMSGPVQLPISEGNLSHGVVPLDSGTPSNMQSRPNRLSRSILRITRSGPKETNFAIVDVPGLVRGGDTNEECKTAKALVQNYLKNPRSIVVAVIDIVDLERQEISQMLDEIPDKESRVIGVINKCDTKQKKSHEWVFDLIRNTNRKVSPIYLKEGWFGLRNRSPSEQDVSEQVRDQTEQSFFASKDWEGLDCSKLGRDNLTKALVRMAQSTHQTEHS